MVAVEFGAPARNPSNFEDIFCGQYTVDEYYNLVKVRGTVIRDMLFADDATIASHAEQPFQDLMDRFSQMPAMSSA